MKTVPGAPGRWSRRVKSAKTSTEAGEAEQDASSLAADPAPAADPATDELRAKIVRQAEALARAARTLGAEVTVAENEDERAVDRASDRSDEA